MKLELINESSCRKLSLTLLLIIFNNTLRYVNDLKNNNNKITSIFINKNKKYTGNLISFSRKDASGWRVTAKFHVGDVGPE